MSKTVKQFAALLQSRQHHVGKLIANGELRAVNVALNPKGKKRWLILDEDAEAFFERRRLQVAGPRQKKRKPKRNITQYF